MDHVGITFGDVHSIKNVGVNLQNDLEHRMIGRRQMNYHNCNNLLVEERVENGRSGYVSRMNMRGNGDQYVVVMEQKI